MRFTASKDCDKVNQILPVLKEHFGNNVNLARIKFMSLLLHALVIAQTVSLHKLASFMPTEVGRGSNMRRIQRFLSRYVLDLDLIARMIFSLLPVKENIVLSMDRTNWKFGTFNINILMLGITFRNVAFPIFFRLMPKRGNSKWTKRKELVERFIRLFGKDCIDCLVADREFVGKEWVDSLIGQTSDSDQTLKPFFIDICGWHSKNWKGVQFESNTPLVEYLPFEKELISKLKFHPLEWD